MSVKPAKHTIDKPLFSFLATGKWGMYREGGKKKWHVVFQRRRKNGRQQSYTIKYAAPTNRRKPAQQAWRARFAAAVHAWQALTAEQKAVYTKIGSRAALPGYGVFIHKFLKQ